MNSSGARIGYARTSTVDQNLDAQIAALTTAGCGMVRREQKSGASLEDRAELKTILDFIHPGETLVVTRIDRLARSMRDLQVIVARLKEKGAHLAATEQPVDTSTAAGKAFFDMLGVFAEFETNLRQATVLGMVGAGGIGFELVGSMKLFQYQDTATCILVIVAMVMAADYISSRLRAWIQQGAR